MRLLGFIIPQEVGVLEENDKYGKYVFMPLERGYGVTIGNALRRVLLSSIEGAGVIAVRFDGVSHEFTAIDGILEDVPEIILNIKRLRFRVYGDDESQYTARIYKIGPGEVRARDLECETGLEVVNVDEIICHITKENVTFAGELIVMKGRGFLPVEEFPLEFQKSLPHGFIMVDGLFSPVTKVNFTIEKMRIRERTDYEKLILEIWTDGIVTPREALTKASQILIDHFTKFSKFRKGEPKIVERAEEYTKRERLKNLLIREIDALKFSVPTLAVLRDIGYNTIASLVSKKREEILANPLVTEEIINEIDEKLREFELEYGMNVYEYLEEFEEYEAQEKDS